MNFDHIGLVETGWHYTYLNENNKIPHRFRGQLMHHQLDAQKAFNLHDKNKGPYQHSDTVSLTISNFIGCRKKFNNYSEGLGRWTWQLFFSQGSANFHKMTLYIPDPPATSGGSASVYTQHLTHFSQIWRNIFPMRFFMVYP